MIRKSFIALFTILLLVILVLSAMQVKVVEANPYWIWNTVDSIPGAIPPSITVQNLQNNSIYSSDRIIINLTVTKPHMNNSEFQGYSSDIYSIKYAFDDEFTQEVPRSDIGKQLSYKESCNTTLTSPLLSVGNHRLTVKVEAVVLISSANQGNHSLSKFWITDSSTVLFTIDTQSLEPSPTQPSIPILQPTVNTGSHVNDGVSSLPYIIVIVAIVTVVILGLLVYFKKYHKKETNDGLCEELFLL